MARELQISLPFLAACGLFFALNDLGRGEWGGLLYTSTKCAPIVLLAATSAAVFGSAKAGQYTTLGLLFSAIGDYFLASRSLHESSFWAGVCPFALGHVFFTMAYFRGHFWLPAALLPAAAHIHITWTLWNKFSFAMKFFVAGYGLFLGGAICAAISHWRKYRQGGKGKKNPASWGPAIRVLGFLVFAVSDSTLTWDHFEHIRIERSQLYVMITYYLAELLIFLGNYVEHQAIEAQGKRR